MIISEMSTKKARPLSVLGRLCKTLQPYTGYLYRNALLIFLSILCGNRRKHWGKSHSEARQGGVY